MNEIVIGMQFPNDVDQTVHFELTWRLQVGYAIAYLTHPDDVMGNDEENWKNTIYEIFI